MLSRDELYLVSEKPLVKVFYETDIDGTEYWCLWHDGINFLPDNRKWLPLTEQEAEYIIYNNITNLGEIMSMILWRGFEE